MTNQEIYDAIFEFFSKPGAGLTLSDYNDTGKHFNAIADLIEKYL